jgi:hypothetical protein
MTYCAIEEGVGEAEMLRIHHRQRLDRGELVLGDTLMRLAQHRFNNDAGPKDHAQDSVSKTLIPDIELRRPAPHGTAFARMNGGDTCRHSRQL